MGGTANDFIFVSLVIECNTVTTKQEQEVKEHKRTSFIMLGLEP